MKTLYCLVALVLLASFVVAESNIEIVFDSSASMSEQIEGERKIDIAKSVVTDYLNSVSEANFALRLYGHRSSECTDTELVLPFGSEKSLINAAVQKMEPVGLTPIEHSLRQAARDLPRSQENFIILVSDGEETCGGDPCKAVRELKESGIGFVLYAVGFGIDEAGRAQLECMAKEGGGQYFDTSDADSLANAFQKIDARRMTRLAVGSRDPQQGTPAQKEPPMMGTFDVPDVQIYDSDRRANLGISPTVVNKETGGLLDFGDFAYFYPEACFVA